MIGRLLIVASTSQSTVWRLSSSRTCSCHWSDESVGGLKVHFIPCWWRQLWIFARFISSVDVLTQSLYHFLISITCPPQTMNGRVAVKVSFSREEATPIRTALVAKQVKISSSSFYHEWSKINQSMSWDQWYFGRTLKSIGFLLVCPVNVLLWIMEEKVSGMEIFGQNGWMLMFFLTDLTESCQSNM